MPSSVIACHAQIKIPDSRLQWNEQLKPLHYLFGGAEVTESANDEVFKEFRNDFIANRLARFQKTNAVATKVTDERGWYASSLFCKVCNSENDPTASEYTICGGAIEERKYSLDYTNIDDIINVLKNKKPTDMSVIDEADLMNPNSYDHLTRILRNHGTHSGQSVFHCKYLELQTIMRR